MIRPKRSNTVWLLILSVLIGMVLVFGEVTPLVQLVLLGIFALALVASFVDLGASRSLLDQIQGSPLLNRDREGGSRTSPEAREAQDKARSRGGFFTREIDMIDVGLIATQTGSEGMVMRRTRTISKDDDGVRPFITLNIPPAEADQNATLRFEMIDQTGTEQYIHEMQVYLRDGEMNILSDHHLPLMENALIEGQGDWDLRVHLDDVLVGIHTFSLTPSSEDRRARLSRDRDAAPRHYVTGDRRRESTAPVEEDEAPMSLEDLLRGDGPQNSERR